MAKATRKRTASEAKAKGRQPIEWTGLFVKGVFLGEVGVFASQKTAVRSVVLTDDPDASAKPPAAAPAEKPAAKSSKPSKPEPPVEPEQMYVRIKEGKSVDQTFPLSEEQLQAYRSFETKFGGARGIHIRKIVPGAAVAGFSHKNVFFLSPRESVADTDKAYRCLHEILHAQYLAAVAHRIHGKGFDPVAITAVEEGLVMWQLPTLGTVHNIKDGIPSRWQGAEVAPQERTLFSKLVQQLSVRGLRQEDLQNPLTRYLEKLAAGARASGTPPTSSSEDQYPNLMAALETLVK